MNQNGSGTTTLTGNSTYSGPTAINAGTLQLGNGGTSGSIASQAITDNGTLAVNRSDTVTLNQAISGTGSLNQNGSGTTTLTGNNSYSGPTAINAGTLQLGNGGKSGSIASQAITDNGTLALNRSDNITLGAAISGSGALNQNGSGTTTLTGNSTYSGPTAINAGTLQLGNGGTSGLIASQAITNNGTLAVNRSDNVTLGAAISGSGGLNQNGSGTTTLTGNNSYSGPTAINAGTLQLGNGGTSGSIASQAITDNGTLAVNRSDNVTLSQAISGSGGLNQNGSGTTTLTGNNSYSGPTAINKGTLQLGNGGTSGSIASQAITDNGTLALNRSDNVTLGAAISGSGALNQNGSGTTTLTGNSTYSGPTVINAGTLQLGNGGTSGLIASQAITNNGTLAVNRSDNVTLGAAISGTGGLNQNGSGTTTLTGNSTYSGPTAINKGTLQLGNGGTSGSIANSPITDNGVLAINRSDNVLFNQKISGTGALTQNGSGVTTLAANNSYSGPTTINAGTLQLGNGGTTGWITSQPIVNNGTLAINHSDDVVISQLMSGSGAFNQNGPGKITLLADNTYSGPTTINAGILQLGNGGTGGSIASHAITDNGTLAVDRSDNVTLNQAISGSGALNQNGSGTTTLTGNNGYSGPTVINKGTLQLGNGGTSGSIASQAITDNGALTVNRSDDVTLGAVVSGSGALNQNGSGTTILTGNSSYSGPTAINAGTLQLGNGGTSGSIASQAITDNGTLALNRSDDVTLGAAISGTGALNQNGSGTTTLTGNSSYSGPTAINKGTLQLGNGGTSGSIASQAIADNGTLALNRSDDVTLGATISGTGALNQNGSGTTTLTGDSTYSGPTAINAGTLQLGNGGTSGSIASQAITDNGTLALNRSDDVTLGAAISGTGALNQNGLGTTTLTGNNSYSGPTAINAGTLQLGNGGTSGSIASQAITDNGTLTVNRSDDVTLGAVVAGSGALNQNGAGTTTLTGNSTYSGPTAINKGTLQLGNGGTSGSIASQAITDNGTLALNRSDDVTLGAVVSGSGALNQNGAGTTTLTGNNTYSGRTVINKGTLQLGNGGTSGSIASQAIADNGTLALNRSDDVTLGATISGTGGLDQNGSGTTTLTGNNTYSGRTVINKGTLQLGNGGTSGSIASQAIADNGTLALNRSDNVTLGAAISGTGALNQNGSGTTTLTGNNSYSGPTAINAGTLQLGNGGTSGSIASQAITDNGTLALNRSDDVTLGAVVSGKGALNQNGSGTTTLTGNNSYSGPTAINAGTLQLGNGGTSGSIASQAITDNGALTVNRSDDVTLGAVVSGKGALNQNGSGTTTLTGNNSYSGPTAINKGTLQLGNGGTSGSIASQAITDNGTLTLNRSDDVTLGGAISGTGVLNQNGSGTTTLTGNSTYSGPTTINKGTLQLGNGGTSGSIASQAITDNGTLTVNRSDDVTLGAAISGTGGLNQNGSGTTTLTGNNSYSGPTAINKGTLQLGNGGTSGSIASQAITDNGTLVVNRRDDVTLGQTISGTGGLSQNGSGTTILTGANSYNGPTAVNAGTLQIDGQQGEAKGPTTVASQAALAGNGLLGGAVTVNDGGILSPGDGERKTGTLRINGDLNLAQGSTQNWDVGQSYHEGGVYNDLVHVGGNLNLSGTLNVATNLNGTTVKNGALEAGVYRIYTYGGELSGQNNEKIGKVEQPPGISIGVQTSIDHQVNLLVQNTDGLNLWNGGSGGGGVWSGAAGNNNPPSKAMTVFEGGAGDVTVKDHDSAGNPTPVTTGGMQFANNDGKTYTVSGDPIYASQGRTVVRVGDGTHESSGTTAVVNSPIDDSHVPGGTSLDKTDAGKTTLTNDNTYTGDTNINHGTLQLGDGGTTGSIASKNINNNGTLSVNRSDDVKLDQHISGTGGLNQDGTGKTTLTNDNTYTGDTNINHGTLQLGDGGTTGSIASKNINNNGTLSVNRSDDVKLDQHISGTGGLNQDGTGKTTLTNDNTYTGDTNINHGTLQLGDGGTTGSIKSKNINNNGTLSVNRSDDVKLDQHISGTGGLNQDGTGKTTLTNDNSYAGPTNVNAGTLQVDGNQSGSHGLTSVASGATLAGNGTIGGDVAVHNGGTLSPGGSLDSAGKMTINGGLSFDPNARQDWNMGQASKEGGQYNDFVNVKGNLQLGGTINISTARGGPDVQDNSLGGGVYRMYSYGGKLSGQDNLNGVMSNGVLDPHLGIQTSIDKQVNLISSHGGELSFWDGSDVAQHGANNRDGNSSVDGGDGVWTAINGSGDYNWTNANGSRNAPWASGSMAIFQGKAGHVTVKDQNVRGQNAPVMLSGMQFANLDNKSYLISGDALHAATANTIIRVGDGTSEGTGITAEVASVIDDGSVAGGTALTKTDSGTLILSGDNQYHGDTRINGGTLQLGNGGTTGSVASKNILDNGDLVINHSNDVALAQKISGTGMFHQIGTGKTTLLNDNSYTGDTTIDHGTLQLGNGGTTGSIAGQAIVNNGALAVNHSNDLTLGQRISGSGDFHQVGTGTTTLTNDNTYQGDTTIDHGTLQLGNGGTTGSIASKNILNNSALAVNHSNDLTLGQRISGTGSFHQVGTGKTVLTNDNSYTGDTTIDHGTLQLGNGGKTGSFASKKIVNNGVFAVNRSNDVALNQLISGTGAFHQVGTGQTTLTNDNTYQGDTTIEHGALQLGDGGSTGSIAGQHIVNNGTLAVNHSNDVTVGQQVSGSGDFHQAGTGKTTLTNDNSYQGTTFVDQGALQFGDGGTTGSVQSGAIVNNGVLAVNRSNDAVFGQNISGTGAFSQDGTGTTVLTNDNHYQGDTTINHGTLQLGNGGETGSIASQNIVNNGTLAVNHSNDVTLGQQISGTGAFHQDGTGRTILTNDNTYTGDTTINHGTLQLGNGGEAGSVASKNIINNGVLSVNRSDDVTLGQQISGSGAFHQDGPGMTMMVADNTYKGDTTVNGGVLQLGDGGTTGAVESKKIVNNGQLIINHSDNVQFDHVISGSGDFIQAGSGRTILKADNTYTGDTIVEPGSSLEIGNGATNGSISASNLINDGTLYINRSDSVLMAQTISGSGNIIANGQGHMTMMTENNTYTGDFHLMSGTIVGSPRSFGTGAVIDDAMLIMNKPGVMKDELRGTGTFVAGGDGVLHLPSNRDDSHFTGQVLVQKGTMKVDGNFQNAKMDVTQGATLSGGGSVGQTHVGQGGTLAATVVDKKDDVQLAQQAAPSLMLRSLFVEEDAAPVAPVVQSAPQEESSPVGVLSVHGDLGMDHDSHLVAQGTTTATGQTMEVNGRSYQQLQSSLIKVIGTAALKGGTVDFNVPEGTKISARQGYTLLTASKGVTGHYDGLNTNLLGTSAFLSPQLAYAADDVDVIMKNNGTSFASIAQTAQQAMIGNALQHMPENSQLVQEMEALNAADARHAMKSLSGEVHASARTALIQDSYYARQAVLDRLDSADCDGSPTSGGMGVADLKTGRKVNACLSNRPVLWGQSYGSLGNNGGNGGASAMHHSTTGFVMGADAPVFATWRVGGLVSYGRSMFNLKGDSNSSGHSNNITIGGYAGNHWGNLHLRLGAAYTWNIMNTRRSVAVGAYNGRMTSGYLGGTAQAFAELGYKFHMRHAVIEPFANVAYVNLHMNGYHEHGGDAALRGHGMDTGVTFSTFGMRASTSFMVGKTVITPQAMFAYRHSFGLRTPSARAMFAGASAGSIETVGAPLSSNSAVLKLGMTAKLTNRIDVGVSYIGQYGTHSVDSGAEGHVRLAF
ncbi:autotransporter-associated beta strand repeat-containing protein [Saccharibacter sp. EH60]|uniref:autotransporter-associated beta strand repeat-containing protein n=2 Tax=unclassified Saccharibacter TaxID=2648722 RepID=UPI001F43A041|nr:autotransporter-associated beta strand repeat-containing protein [Saccharibacter sp. EH60]